MRNKEEKYIVVGFKGEKGKGTLQYGPSYDSKAQAQAVADKKNKQSKYKVAGISFSIEKGSLQEATTKEEKYIVKNTNLANRAFELEIDFMEPNNKFGDKWQKEVSRVLVRKYDGHWKNWANDNPKELEMLLNKFEAINYMNKLKKYDIHNPNSKLFQLNENEEDVNTLNALTKKYGKDVVLYWLSSGNYGENLND